MENQNNKKVITIRKGLKTIPIDTTDLEKHTEDFLDFLKYISDISCPLDNFYITDEQYERIIQPYKEWLTKRNILRPNEPIETRLNQCNLRGSKDIDIVIDTIDYQLTLPKTLKNIIITIDVDELGLNKNDAKIIIKDFSSIRKTKSSIGNIMELIIRDRVEMGIESYIKLEKVIIKYIEQMLKSVNTLFKYENPSSAHYIQAVDILDSIWNSAKLPYINQIVEKHLNMTGLNTKNNTFNKLMHSVVDLTMELSTDYVLESEDIGVGEVDKEKIKDNLTTVKSILCKIATLKQKEIQHHE